MVFNEKYPKMGRPGGSPQQPIPSAHPVSYRRTIERAWHLPGAISTESGRMGYGLGMDFLIDPTPVDFWIPPGLISGTLHDQTAGGPDQ